MANKDAAIIGVLLSNADAVIGHDMTVESAVTKLTVLFGKGLSPADVHTQMERPLAGELTAEWFNMMPLN